MVVDKKRQELITQICEIYTNITSDLNNKNGAERFPTILCCVQRFIFRADLNISKQFYDSFNMILV